MPASTDMETLAHSSLSLVESAIARLGRRPRGEGVALPGLTTHWGGAQNVVGYAIPVTLSTEDGYPFGKRENLDWWHYVEAQKGPKVIVAQVLTKEQGTGAACGAVSAHVLKSLGCAGFLTDGFIRDQDLIARSGLLVAARGTTLRHGSPHVVRFGDPVSIYGMSVSSGDVVVAGKEGALAFPAEWLTEIPHRLKEVSARVDPFLHFCREKRTAQELAAAMAKMMPPAQAETSKAH